MSQISFKRLGKYAPSEWQIYSVGVSGAADSPEPIELVSEKFVCLFCTHNHVIKTPDIEMITEKLLRLGCVYFCCWGADSERVHNVIDEIVAGEGKNITWLDVITSWHRDESLPQVIDFFLDSVQPAHRYLDTCRSAVAITIGEEMEVMQVELTIAMKLINPLRPAGVA